MIIVENDGELVGVWIAWLGKHLTFAHGKMNVNIWLWEGGRNFNQN